MISLEESKAITIMRHVFFEMALMGTGILKGPFTDTKEYNSFSTAEDDEGNVEIVHATKMKNYSKYRSCIMLGFLSRSKCYKHS